MALSLNINGLNKSFHNKTVLNNLDLDVKNGESFVVLGGSGAGKSVLLNNVANIMTPDSGKIIMNGKDIALISAKERERILDKISVLFQAVGLFDFITIWENVAFYFINKLKMNKKEAKQIALEKLSQVGISSKSADLSPSEISLGMQKRVGLARALATDPDLILLDEPTSGLDPVFSTRIGKLIKSLKNNNTTSLTITHDINLAHAIGDRIGLLHGGKFVWTGTKDEFVSTDNEAINQFKNGEVKGPLVFDGH